MSGMFDDQADQQPDATPGGAWVVPLGWRADNEGTCRSCGAEILWCHTPAGKRAPINRDGTSHFANCPDAIAWRRRR